MDWKVNPLAGFYECLTEKGLYLYGYYEKGVANVHLPDGTYHVVPWDEARAFCLAHYEGEE